MKLLSEIMGFDRTFFLEASAVETGIPLAVKTTPEIRRVEKQELENMYLDNPVVFNSVNKLNQIIMSADHKIVAHDPKVQDFFDKFIHNIGYSGGETFWGDLLQNIFKSQIIYGDAWIELIYNTKGNRIVDLDVIDSKKMDFAKDGSRRIVLDKFGNPVGYVQTIPFGIVIPEGKRIKPPDDRVMLMGNQIFIPKENVAHFKLYSVGDGFYGIGLVEPIFKTSQSKIEMERALTNAVWRVGFPMPVAYCGDPNHDPTPEQVRKVWEKIKDTNYKYGFAFPYYNKIEFLEAKHPEKLKQHLNYWIDQEVTGIGIAKAFATGSGEATNRATLGRQEYIMKLTLKDTIKRTIHGIESKVFRRISELEGFKEVPRIEWGEVTLEELDAKIERIVSLSKQGLITADADLEHYLRKLENLPIKK